MPTICQFHGTEWGLISNQKDSWFITHFFHYIRCPSNVPSILPLSTIFFFFKLGNRDQCERVAGSNVRGHDKSIGIEIDKKYKEFEFNTP